LIDKILKDIYIKKIDTNSAEDLAELLKNENPEYSQYFTAFNFDYQTIKQKLNNLKKDSFWGIYLEKSLIGFHMLRGFDEGYDIPSYGVFISKDFSGKGLSKLTLQHAISYCKINGIKQLMLKVHPENLVAKKIYEDFGFKQTGVDKKNDNLIYHKKLS
jgi:RimJ/RimL family protein N-acetyltransferase